MSTVCKHIREKETGGCKACIFKNVCFTVVVPDNYILRLDNQRHEYFIHPDYE